MRECGLRCLAPIVATVALLACPASATADGLPILGVDASRTGLTDSSGSRYVTFDAGHRTVVARVEVDGGEVTTSRVIDGRFTIPAVAYDASPSGLSADGRTLVLVRPRVAFPQRHTTLAVIDTERLRVRDVVTLDGDFSFDAISPDGSTAYLIHYRSRRDPTRYEVRAFDLESERLLPEPIVDPEEPDERMAGLPISRASSTDGRWAYTLYDGNGHEPFIHALDTAGQRAVCIDLPQLEDRRNLYLLALQTRQRGRELVVLPGRSAAQGSGPLLSVDTKSFEVSVPASADSAPDDGGGAPWLPIGVAAAALAFAIAWIVRRQREATAGKQLEGA
jgi:hypothetical protein